MDESHHFMTSGASEETTCCELQSSSPAQSGGLPHQQAGLSLLLCPVPAEDDREPETVCLHILPLENRADSFMLKGRSLADK